MNYGEALQYLSQLGQLGVRPGTDRLAVVLRHLGDPQLRPLAVHIAGTNGKGSTAAFCAALLVAAARAAGKDCAWRIGLYTSPHLSRVRERIQWSDPGFSAASSSGLALRECSEVEFAEALSAVRTATLATGVELTFFEVLTAAAFLIFANQKIDVAVIETGLGGRYDATRLCRAGVTVITSIGLDHTEILGPTLCDIAREKAGIFCAAVPALAACEDGTARAVLCAEASRVGAPLWLYEHRGELEAHPLPPLPAELVPALPLAGAHQQRNAALALAALAQLPHPLAATIQQREVQEAGLRATRWPGRLEQLWPHPGPKKSSAALAARVGALPPDGCELLIDAAHNPEGSQALARFLDEKYAGRPLTILFGVVTGKAAAEMAEPLYRARQVILTRPPSPRGLTPSLLAPRLPLEIAPRVVLCDDWRQALREALAATPTGGLLLAYGSIFLIGALRALWLGEASDPLWLQDPAAGKAI